MDINVDLLKQVTDVVDWLLKFPQAVVGAVLGPKEDYLNRKERIAKLKELAELREIGKSVQQVAFVKGSLVAWVEAQLRDKPSDGAFYLRETLADVANGMERIAETIRETSLSGLSVSTDAMQYLGRGAMLLRKVAQLPDDALLSEQALLRLAKDVEGLLEGGSAIVARVDDYRRLLDHTYG